MAKKNIFSFVLLGLGATLFFFVNNNAFANGNSHESTGYHYMSGLYFSAQPGIGRTDIGSGMDQYLDWLSATQGQQKYVHKENFGLRVLVGYSFNQYLSAEAGYSIYPNLNYKSSALGITTVNLYVKTYAIDMIGKLSLPLTVLSPSLERWSIYGKGGVAYTTVTFDTDARILRQDNFGWQPTYGAGIAYNWTDNIALDLSWSEIYGNSKLGFNPKGNPQVTSTSRVIPTCDLFALGITYKFTSL
ncbi:MAG: outer membrane beta-barrel protein [Gammaproteobacteria bacterium]|nr:outer membrane beta-barrel protein [Gammaproteobacteria bacterium]